MKQLVSKVQNRTLQTLQQQADVEEDGDVSKTLKVLCDTMDWLLNAQFFLFSQQTNMVSLCPGNPCIVEGEGSQWS